MVYPVSRRAALCLRAHLKEREIPHETTETEYTTQNSGLPFFKVLDVDRGEELVRTLEHLGIETERRTAE